HFNERVLRARVSASGRTHGASPFAFLRYLVERMGLRPSRSHAIWSNAWGFALRVPTLSGRTHGASPFAFLRYLVERMGLRPSRSYAIWSNATGFALRVRRERRGPAQRSSFRRSPGDHPRSLRRGTRPSGSAGAA